MACSMLNRSRRSSSRGQNIYLEGQIKSSTIPGGYTIKIEDRNEAEILNLETGKTATFAGSEAWPFYSLQLFDRYLVMISVGA